MKTSFCKYSRHGYSAALVAAALGLGATAWAQQTATVPDAVQVPADAMTVAQVESRLTALGFKVKEIELHDLLAEAEVLDAQGRELDLTIDRRNGEILAMKYD